MASFLAQLTYFKRFRMERDLQPPPRVPDLPSGFSWIPWKDQLLETHAEVKFQCFVGEMDAVVFPNLSHRPGCLLLMQEIRRKAGFCPKATWMIEHGGMPIATVQGVGDRFGCGAIQNLGVLADYRGRGLGTALLLQALHGFRESRLQRAMLEVTAKNEDAIRLYRRLGFRCRKTIYRVQESPSAFAAESDDFDWLI